MSTYKLEVSPITKGEWRLTLRPDDARGVGLADALRGRHARELDCWFLSPARALKWRKLYHAGFAAKVITVRGERVMRFDRPPGRHHFRLDHAIHVATALAASNCLPIARHAA